MIVRLRSIIKQIIFAGKNRASQPFCVARFSYVASSASTGKAVTSRKKHLQYLKFQPYHISQIQNGYPGQATAPVLPL